MARRFSSIGRCRSTVLYAQNGLPNAPSVKGDAEQVRQHLTAMRPTFPRMANYSFDYGNAHWTFIDSNVYVDWSDAYLRNWLARDLALAVDATWKFVVFHHPPFNSSRAHFSEQQMRLISDILEHRGVDVVFNGHVHNYQRTYPLRFLARPALDRTFRSAPSYVVEGDFTLDKSYDGAADTTPDGVLYIVTGAGGAGRVRSRSDRQPADLATVHGQADRRCVFDHGGRRRRRAAGPATGVGVRRRARSRDHHEGEDRDDRWPASAPAIG